MSQCIKCGSYAFNLYKEGIDQGGLCDVHYWKGRAHRAEALAEQSAQQEFSSFAEWASDYVRDNLHKLKPAQQEPVAWMHQIDCDRDDRDDFMAYYKQTPGYCIPLYTSPPAQRTWVGLTNDEYEAICDKHSEMSDFDFLEDIEAKLRSKNI